MKFCRTGSYFGWKCSLPVRALQNYRNPFIHASPRLSREVWWNNRKNKWVGFNSIEVFSTSKCRFVVQFPTRCSSTGQHFCFAIWKSNAGCGASIGKSNAELKWWCLEERLLVGRSKGKWCLVIKTDCSSLIPCFPRFFSDRIYR